MPQTPTATNTDTETLVSVENLQTLFRFDVGTVHAVEDVSFRLRSGKTLGIVGESGCGKSVTAQSIMRIVPRPGEITRGTIRYRDTDAVPPGEEAPEVDLTRSDPSGEVMRHIRGNKISMIFQEPMTAFSLQYRVVDQVAEPLFIHGVTDSKNEAFERAEDMLRRVGIPRPKQVLKGYPFELSGGMRQRAMIAMALINNPQVLVADEPTTALDVTIQAQILTLLRNLQQQYRMSIMFITHDLGVIAQMCDEVAVMYLGRIVEYTDVRTLFRRPLHPYTWALLKSIPRLGVTKRQQLEPIKGNVPNPYWQPKGCPFANRCPSFMSGTCDVEEPPLQEVEPGHYVRCYLYESSA